MLDLYLSNEIYHCSPKTRQAYGVYASLCIAAELGLSSLIDPPKRLLKGKRNAKGPKNAAYGTSFFAATFLTCAFVVTAQRTPGARCPVSPTAAVGSLYLGDHQEPDRVAPWLLRTASRGTRLAA